MAQITDNPALPIWAIPPSTNTGLQQGLGQYQGAQIHPVVKAALDLLQGGQITQQPQQGLAPSVSDALIGGIPKNRWEIGAMLGLPFLGVVGKSLVKDAPWLSELGQTGADLYKARTDGEIPSAEVVPNYHSNVLTAFSNPKLPNVMTREQAMSVLNAPGVKSEENKWLGMPEFLSTKPKWNRQEIQDYIKDNQIDVKEIQAQQPPPQYQLNYIANPLDDDTFKAWRREQYSNGALEKVNDNEYRFMGNTESMPKEELRSNAHWDLAYHNKFEDPQTQRLGPFATKDDAISKINELDLQPQHNPRVYTYQTGEDPTLYSQYTLPNGSNYREVLLQWANPNQIEPARQQWGIWNEDFQDWSWDRGPYYTQEAAQVDADERQANDTALGYSPYILEVRPKPPAPTDFYNNHFEDDPNILAHLRLTDRMTPDGKKVLFMEEAQSDWQKKLRQKDLAGQDPTQTWDYQASKILHDKGLGDYAPLSADQVASPQVEPPNPYNDVRKTPDAPLARNYEELAMKRAMRMAAEGGYDALGWTTGKQQADRYNQVLQGQVSHIEFDPSTRTLRAETPQGPKEFPATISSLPDLVGKDAAIKLVQGLEPQEPVDMFTAVDPEGRNVLSDRYFNTRDEILSDLYYNEHLGDRIVPVRVSQGPAPSVLEGKDLQIGERGYNQVYDSKLPSFADKIGKKFGAQHSIGTITTGGTGERNSPVQVHMIPVTPQLRQSALTKGFPLFTAAGAATALAALRQREQAKERQSSPLYIMH